MTSSGTIIDVIDATKRFGDPALGPAAVDGVSLSVRRGELLALLGESGSGKTTLLKAINRLLPLTSGSIAVDGRDVSKGSAARLRRGIGYAFQGVGLFPHMTVAQNVATTPRLLRWKPMDVELRVEELLTLVGLNPAEFRNRLPHELSGGQRQRVGVARALAAKPAILLLDEPFGALDPLTRDDLQREYRAIHDRLGLTTVLVTHDMTEALLMADRVAVMKSGRVLQIGTPHELLSAPADAYVSRLMSKPKQQAERVEAMWRGEAGPERSEGPDGTAGGPEAEARPGEADGREPADDPGLRSVQARLDEEPIDIDVDLDRAHDADHDEPPADEARRPA